ncbi:MAG: hypothetical protein RQ732_08925 [Methylophaga sp.]|nr:hypothetical protein [Methylophaga sp.]
MHSLKVFLRFWQLLMMTSMVLMSQSLQAEQPASDLKQVTADNLPAFVNQLSNDYYQQLESLVNYYQLYQQKRDPRGFNVWHLRGFSPAFTERQSYYLELQDNAATETQQTVASLVEVFNDLDAISTQLMVSFRENDPAAYQQAKTLVNDNNAFLTKQLEAYQLDSEIREITFN